MRTYKSIERPSQILGIDLSNLFILMGFAIGSGVVLGGLSMIISIHWSIYVIDSVLSISMFYFLKFLSKNRPPGFALGFLSFHTRQPSRLTISQRPSTHVLSK